MLRDCLYLNWAFRADDLPAPQKPLRFHVHRDDEVDYVFGSVQLFRRERMRMPRTTKLNLSHPQLDFRWQVLADDGSPAVLLHRVLVPAWLAPGARLLTRHAVGTAKFGYPAPSEEPETTGWSWRVRGAASFVVSARRTAPQIGPGPSLGGWERTTRYFTERPVGFLATSSGLRKVHMEPPDLAVWPLTVDIEDWGLLERLVPVAPAGGWPALHSAWLCPEVPIAISRVVSTDASLARGLPAPG